MCVLHRSDDHMWVDVRDGVQYGEYRYKKDAERQNFLFQKGRIALHFDGFGRDSSDKAERLNSDATR